MPWGRKVISATAKKPPKYVYTKQKSKNATQVREGALQWALDVAFDNRFHYGGRDPHHNGCYFCKHQVKKHGAKMRMYCYCCNPFVHAAYVHGGGAKALKSRCGHNALSFEARSGSGYFHGSKYFKRIHNPSWSKLLPGDVMCLSNHAFMYAGKKGGHHYIVEASGGDDNRIGSKRWNNSIHTERKSSIGSARCYRYIGKGGGKMYRRADCIGVNAVDTGGGADSTGSGYGQVSDDGSGIVLEKEIAKLWSSDNYEFVDLNFENEQSEQEKKWSENIAKLADAHFAVAEKDSNAAPEPLIQGAIDSIDYSSKYEANKIQRLKGVKTTNLLSYPNFVEAPTIVLDFNGVKIGGYGNTGDTYPNYIESMQVNKVNGRINQYTFNLVYQIRPNEDPNFIDKLIARTGYRNPLKILYGDSNYNAGYFRDESAIITDAKHNEDPSSSKITYTITALSSVSVATKTTQTYSNLTSQPSSAVYNLLYDSGDASVALLSAFPGMADKAAVASNNLIPNTDAVVNIGGMTNANPVSYLSHLTSCMTNAAGEVSSYFLTYCNDNKMNGDYFKISEVKKVDSNSTFSANSAVYEIDVGYPTDNFVTNFQVSDNNYWSLAYKFAGNINSWEYDVDRMGNVTSQKVNLLEKSQKYSQTGLIESNWWKQVTEFPISAKLTLKGLVSPAMLMSYIQVNVMFYGQVDMSSGLYVVTEENDTISGNGYSTELTLLRVSE